MDISVHTKANAVAAIIIAGLCVFAGWLLYQHETREDRIVAVFANPELVEVARVESWDCMDGDTQITLAGLYIPPDYELGVTNTPRTPLPKSVRNGAGIGSIDRDGITHPVLFHKTNSRVSWHWQPGALFSIGADGSGTFKHATYSCRSRLPSSYTKRNLKESVPQLFAVTR